MNQNRGLLLGAVTAVLAICFSAGLHESLVCVLFNPSESAPRGWYWRTVHEPYIVGRYVFARLPDSVATLAAQRGYLPRDVLLLKRVAAVHGDLVCVRDGLVTINGEIIGALLPHDGIGRPLVAWPGCRSLVADEVFLMSRDSAASFDSRYFGPVHYSDLRGGAIALLTW